MAQVTTNLGEGSAGSWFARGKDHGKPVRYKVRAVPPEEDRRIRQRVMGNVKGRKLGRETANVLLDRAEMETVERACYALVDTENFAVEIGDQAAAAFYAEQLKLATPPPISSEVLLDGQWTDELRRVVLTAARNVRRWLSDKADAIVEREVEDEEEAAEDF